MALGQAGIAADRKYSAATAGPGNGGPTYSAIVGATIIFDFWKIIIRGAPILGWIRLLSSCSPQEPPAIRDKYYAKREKFDLSALLSRTKREGGGGRWRRASGDSRP